MYILLYVQDQYSYDKQHKDVDRIFRLTTNLTLTGDKHHGASSSPPIAPAMKHTFPEVINYTRVVETDKLGAKEHLLRYKEQSFYENEAYYVDSTFFDVFSYHFIEGHAPHALDEPYSIVLLKKTSDKLFGSQPALGKLININDAYGKHDFKVTGVVDETAKEVGVRKVIGAGKYDLIKQFLGESFLLAFIGVVIALPLLWFLLPYLNGLTHTDIKLAFFADYRLWLMLATLVAVTGLVAGSYPAFYLSAFEAIKVIKGNFSSKVSAAGIRRSLVVFQFVLSIVLITGIIIIYSQLNYIKSKDLGFDKNQKLVFNFYTDDAQAKMTALANDLSQLSGVKAVTKADNYLSQFVMHDHGVYPAGGNMETAIDAQNIACDQFFVKVNGIKLVSGRDFMPGDSGKVLINQTLARRLNINEQHAAGARLYTHYGNNPESFVTVAGVMKDFNYNSLHNDVRPFMLVYNNNVSDLSCMVVSTNSGDYKTLLTQMGAVWKKDMPSVPFEYSFLDSEVQKQYETEIVLSQIINSFTLVAILISCLGLFGLAAFSAEQRSKEISIRKVLGSSVSGIVQLLSKDFLLLVLVSFVIATPIAWYGMNKWLQAFAYRIPLSWWMFGLAGFLALLIAMLTVSFQAIRAAIANPIKSLKAE
eukprot:gene3770-3817_t